MRRGDLEGQLEYAVVSSWKYCNSGFMFVNGVVKSICSFPEVLYNPPP